MRYLTIGEVIEVYIQIISTSGGSYGIRDLAALQSAIAQPRMIFGGGELYPTEIEKASALGYSLIQNHPFIDGNKRTGHAAMETFLILNGLEIDAPLAEQERVIFDLASSILSRQEFTEWLSRQVKEAKRS